ncbi:helix-turn-helix transcriptional regulator [Pleomorphomonas sp. JP5]|uniref:helix-turn-helix transcriptional regulator n=1 Tax=Pleomorphomonas sp. JP5 TaxID=2942998 RepID=UPI0020441CE1|nr:helix-turn-helix transcriptional regulator [Pleomorphomonas sp. JP5]MCM5557245.1 helix-turn-helix transcriptional regulator [Pleomorphomonas sp. JP5]
MAKLATNGPQTNDGERTLPSSPQANTPHSPSRESTVIGRAAELGALVREARKSKGLSQQEFADLAGVGRRFVSNLETGKATIEMDKALEVARSIGLILTARKA